MYAILTKGAYIQSSTYFFVEVSADLVKLLLITGKNGHYGGFQFFSRSEETQELGSETQLLRISNYLKTCPASFPGAQSTALHHLCSLPRAPFPGVEGQQLQWYLI